MVAIQETNFVFQKQFNLTIKKMKVYLRRTRHSDDSKATKWLMQQAFQGNQSIWASLNQMLWSSKQKHSFLPILFQLA